MSTTDRGLVGTLLAIAMSHVKGPNVDELPPFVEYFPADGVKSASCSRHGDFLTVRLADNLDRLELARAIAHEARHLADGDWHDRDALETRASEHEARFGVAYLKAAEILEAEEDVRLVFERHGIPGRARPGLDIVIRESGELDRVQPQDLRGAFIGRAPRLTAGSYSSAYS